MLLKIVKSSNVALLVFLLTTNNLVYAQGSGLDLNPGQKMETDGSTFLFGQSMSSVDTDSGSSITRAGFGTNMSSENTNSSSRLSTNQLSSMLTRLEQRPTEGNQGNPNPTPALAGQLISTGNTQGGSSSPDGNLSGDRLTKSYDTQTYGFQPIHSSDSQTNQQPLPKTTPPTAPTPTLPVVQAPAPNPQPPQPRTPPTASASR